ncbi:hypothetical protein CDIK_1799 [Cucumispora dikerogammari]|nr:hypothetical protein CDIK_1799 [Cucumispora dikerogammari]
MFISRYVLTNKASFDNESQQNRNLIVLKKEWADENVDCILKDESFHKASSHSLIQIRKTLDKYVGLELEKLKSTLQNHQKPNPIEHFGIQSDLIKECLKYIGCLILDFETLIELKQESVIINENIFAAYTCKNVTKEQFLAQKLKIKDFIKKSIDLIMKKESDHCRYKISTLGSHQKAINLIREWAEFHKNNFNKFLYEMPNSLVFDRAT